METQRIHLLDQTNRLRSAGDVARVGEEIKFNGVVSRHDGKRTFRRQ
jgi:hypothetical protein